MLHVLGAGSILPRAGYGCAGYALRPSDGGAVTLLDCGPGSVRALGAAGIGLEEVTRVVLTHFHPDHCLDLFALAFARRNPHFADCPPLELIGPPGLRALLETGSDGPIARWITHPSAHVIEVEPERGELERDDLRLAWTRTRHTPESLAWRATTPAGASLTYTGDTGENPDVADLARGTNLFVCECSFPDDQAVEHHLTPSGAARLAERAECRELLLTHFYPSMDPERAVREARSLWPGAVLAAADGSRHPLRPA